MPASKIVFVFLFLTLIKKYYNEIGILIIIFYLFFFFFVILTFGVYNNILL